MNIIDVVNSDMFRIAFLAIAVSLSVQSFAKPFLKTKIDENDSRWGLCVNLSALLFALFFTFLALLGTGLIRNVDDVTTGVIRAFFATFSAIGGYNTISNSIKSIKGAK
jgi:Trk-type K+ transport system membrane component